MSVKKVKAEQQKDKLDKVSKKLTIQNGLRKLRSHLSLQKKLKTDLKREIYLLRMRYCYNLEQILLLRIYKFK